MDQKIIDDLQDGQSKVDAVKSLLNKLYYDQEFSTLFTRPVLSMMIAGCDYLITNLGLLAEKYRVRTQ